MKKGRSKAAFFFAGGGLANRPARALSDEKIVVMEMRAKSLILLDLKKAWLTHSFHFLRIFDAPREIRR
ncbi:hypothetical protein [Paraburkholderia sp. Ac-20347]|uniref:hypothetical protein n=1 Tax=Paraburkholderia sp. Ac-20347 TaxID=2703892 RepID=UPI001980B384|nr:hypothetical protein [Paraburkholderia sp. Ac-20347]MBN3814115.1 hypothetical protein [Paraburkholderia sp. Ac-20347]